jgi:translation initiation factor 1
MFKNHHTEENRTVYTTESGRICPKCGRPSTSCICHSKGNAGRNTDPGAKPGDGIARVRLETKGRKGKSVTTITGIAQGDEALKLFLSDLKRRCGAGGSIKDGVIEIQGDHCDTVIAYLKEKKLTVRRAGG